MSLAGGPSAKVLKLRYHASAGSALYFLTTVCLAIGAINSQNNLLFWAFGISIGGLLISGVISGPAMMGIRIRRETPMHAEVGRPLIVRYVVENRSRLVPAFALTIEEQRRRGRRGQSQAEGPAIASSVAHVGPRELVTSEATIVPERRGVVRLSSFSVWTAFPFGLMKKSVLMGQEATIVVRPRMFKLRPGLLDSISSRSGQLTASRNQSGPGDEPFGLREYQSGDSLRSVWWRATARLGTPVVRQTARPAPLRVWVVIAPSVSQRNRIEAEVAVSLAASVAVSANDRGFAVALSVPGAGVAVLPRPGRRHIERVLDTLAELELDPQPESPAPVTPPRIGKRDGVVVIGLPGDRISPGALLIDLTRAEASLAPGERLPEVPPPAPHPAKRWISEFLGLAELDETPPRHPPRPSRRAPQRVLEGRAP